jgi:BirA family biotin operon repressor/biotin-[acetyl-CoA-carboxylase] ligase
MKTSARQSRSRTTSELLAVADRPAPFNTVLFLELLRHAGCSLGEPFEYLFESPSTNDVAKQALLRGAPRGATFLAERQISGRGRQGRDWYSAAGESLAFSVTLRPRLRPEQLSCLTLAVGLGVRDALAGVVDRPILIKWPNDVLCGRRKLAGVLLECDTHSQPFGVVAGIGVNVATMSFPAPISALATSLVLLGGTPAREPLLVELLIRIEYWIRVLEASQLTQLVDELRRWDALSGRAVSVDGRACVARGIDGAGRLLVEVAGRIDPVQSGTVEIL